MSSQGLGGSGGKVGKTTGSVVQYPRKPFSWVSPLVMKRTIAVSPETVVVGGGANPQCLPKAGRAEQRQMYTDVENV